MKWGALLNKKPSNKKIEELNNLFPHNGSWHTVYEEDDVSIIDGIPIIKKEKDSMTQFCGTFALNFFVTVISIFSNNSNIFFLLSIR